MQIIKRISLFLIAISLAALTLLPQEHQAKLLNPAPQKPRLIVLTDIGGDPDDQQSLIRLMLYSNEFDLEASSPRLQALQANSNRR